MDVIDTMADGEEMQRLIKQQRHSYDQEDWQKIAVYKTGKLFAWSLSAAAHNHPNPNVGVLLNSIGQEMGEVYQLRDDMKDTDEFGEINFVLLKAAEIAGVSPISGEISMIGQFILRAAESARTQLKEYSLNLNVKIETLETLLGHSHDEFQQACLKSLREIKEKLVTE